MGTNKLINIFNFVLGILSKVGKSEIKSEYIVEIMFITWLFSENVFASVDFMLFAHQSLCPNQYYCKLTVQWVCIFKCSDLSKTGRNLIGIL